MCLSLCPHPGCSRCFMVGQGETGCDQDLGVPTQFLFNMTTVVAAPLGTPSCEARASSSVLAELQALDCTPDLWGPGVPVRSSGACSWAPWVGCMLALGGRLPATHRSAPLFPLPGK